MTDIKVTIPSPPDLTVRNTTGINFPVRNTHPQKQASLSGSLHHTDPLDRVAEIVEAHINEITGVNRKVRVEKNEDADRMVYKVIDKNTEEVIRQFPPEDLLKLIAYYRHVEGLGMDGSA